ncbi:MAG: type II toxin-antitoxin system VapC family toxin [Burkholderiales bacterium]
MILLDTHVLIWMNTNDRSLGGKCRREIEREWVRQEVAVSAISFWECAMLHLRGRITLPIEPLDWRRSLIVAGLQEFPVTGEIGILAADLTSLHNDPADRIIAATAIASHAKLLTADRQLLNWKHELRRVDASR